MFLRTGHLSHFHIVKLTYCDRCKDLADGYPFDLYGIQSHMYPGFNYQAVYERFDTLSAGDQSLLISEFDTIEPDLNSRADDLEDFLRAAFSHPKIEQIITWEWTSEAWQDNHNEW